MVKALEGFHPLVFLVIATLLEASGDAVIRMAIYDPGSAFRPALFFAGAVLLFGYGSVLNMAPLDFGRVIGLYIATLFVVWQIVNFISFRALPSLPTLVGGTLVIAGGAIITYWKPA
jgi:small multidrug resistance family-3 protein